MESLISSEDYSPAYKVVVRNTRETTPVSVDMALELRDELQTVQVHLNSFLISEETAMEERIRVFEEAERQKYAQLQSKARSHKNILMSLMLSAKSLKVSDSPSCANNDVSVEEKGVIGHLSQSPLESQITFSAKDGQGRTSSLFCDDDEDDENDNDFVPPLPRRPVSRSNSSTKRVSDIGPISKDFHKGNIVIDDVFQFDPGFQEDPNQPFSESDEEFIDTDDSSLVDDGNIRGSSAVFNSSKKPGDPVEYSTSVPINVPAWMVGGSGRSQIHQYADEEDSVLPQDGKSMAASIKALARSVHGNTSEIFGELPKPPTRARVISAHSGTARS